MTVTAVSGKVIWSSNNLITETTGSFSSSSTIGYMERGTGFVMGGGGGGSITTTRKNIEKARIARFDGGEINIEVECDPLYSVGNIATIVLRDGLPVLYFNQTTEYRLLKKLSLTFVQKCVVFLSLCLAAYFAWKSLSAIGWVLQPDIWYRFNDSTLFGIFWAIAFPGAAIALAGWLVRYARRTKSDVRRAVTDAVRDHAVKYQAEITKSRENHRKMIEDL